MSKERKPDPTANARKKSERERRKEAGLVRRDVWAHPDDWEQVRELEEELQKKRGITLTP